MSAYAVDKVLRRLVIDADFRAALEADPATTLASARPPLEESESQALLDGDVGALSRAGANSFLLWQLARFGLFGLDNDVYADRIRVEYAEERVRMRAEGLLG
jgi:Aromatic-ring-opening dioxygenase LigAB, LigA subunit